MRHLIGDLQQQFRRLRRDRRSRVRRPAVEGLEERALLSAAPHLDVHHHADARKSKTVSAYQQTNLVSNLPGSQLTDSNVVNPWGMALSATSPFWISDEGSGDATIYQVDPSTGAVTKLGLVVKIPSPTSGSGHPTGQVFNSSRTGFFMPGTSTPATFIFDTFEGTIAGWSPSTGAMTIVNNSSTAQYTGLTEGTSNGQTYLYAANDLSPSGIEVYNSSWSRVTLAGSFVDPKLKKGFARSLVPYNIQNIGGELFVTYRGPNFTGGAVAEFNTDGTFVRQVAYNSPKGPLQAPWGIAMAPASFGKYSNHLLVGNFGNGRINAVKGRSLKPLTTVKGTPIVNSGLWALGVGNGGKAGSTGTLYFTAGIDGQADGLFGAIQAVTGKK
jgi:uncharacterized protein (TIGR03118 family)